MRVFSTRPHGAGGATRAGRRTAVIAFLRPGEPELAGIPSMSVGIMSASQGRYSPDQLLLDIGQGARVATSAYPTSVPAPLSLRPVGAGATVDGWPAARRRAADAPQELAPGLLPGQTGG